jgi:hypothetical protein
MQHEVYTGEGTYSKTSLAATYNIYLPLLPAGTYQFYTAQIYNFSCAQYPNTILMFMRVINGPNNDLSGWTNQPGIPVNFSLSPLNIVNIDSHCVPLDKTKNISVIVMHDNLYDTTYAREHAFCMAPTTVVQPDANVAANLYQPKKFKYGTMNTTP